MKRTALGLALLLVALFATGCGGEAEDPAARQSVREATITAEVRSRLLAADGLERLPLEVTTREGTVRVAGGVHDSAQVAPIRAIAEAVRGVERVELDLRLVPPPPDTIAPEPPPRRPEPIVTPQESLPSLEEAG